MAALVPETGEQHHHKRLGRALPARGEASLETGATSGVSSGRFSEGLTVIDIQEITAQKGRFREIEVES